MTVSVLPTVRQTCLFRHKKEDLALQAEFARPSPEQSVVLEEKLDGELHDAGVGCCSGCPEGGCADALRD